MKTIHDLFKAIKNPEFEWKHFLNYAILKNTGDKHIVLDTGTLDPEEPFHIPMYISGTVDINIRGEGYESIQLSNFNANILGAQSTINIPMLLRKDRVYKDDRLVQLEVYNNYIKSKPNWLTLHAPEKAVQLPDRFKGWVEFVWRNEENQIICRRKEFIEPEVTRYMVRLPNKFYEQKEV